jgi:hypothetical protein
LADRYVCDEAGVVVSVKPGEEGYDEAFESGEDADRDCTEVEGTVVTTTPEPEPEEELPFTGVDTGLMSGLAIALLGAGALLLTITRKLENE